MNTSSQNGLVSHYCVTASSTRQDAAHFANFSFLVDTSTCIFQLVRQLFTLLPYISIARRHSATMGQTASRRLTTMNKKLADVPGFEDLAAATSMDEADAQAWVCLHAASEPAEIM